MNPLGGPFPTRARLGGRYYPLGWRVQDCLPVILAYEDEGLVPAEQQEILLLRLYPQGVPPDPEAALAMGALFLDGGGSKDDGEPEDGDEPPLRLYSFTRDGGLIYSAFRSQYGIDLQRDELHWWAFLALFRDLAPEHRFCRLLSLRRGWLEGTLTKEERRLMVEMGPHALPPEQPIDPAAEASALEFLRQLQGGGAPNG